MEMENCNGRNPNVFFAKDMLTFCGTFPVLYFAFESAGFS